jgi:hypothetical protein
MSLRVGLCRDHGVRGQRGIIVTDLFGCHPASKKRRHAIHLDIRSLEDGFAIPAEFDLVRQLGQFARPILHFGLQVIDGDAEPAKPDFVCAFNRNALQGVIEFCSCLRGEFSAKGAENVRPVDCAHSAAWLLDQLRLDRTFIQCLLDRLHGLAKHEGDFGGGETQRLPTRTPPNYTRIVSVAHRPAFSRRWKVSLT